MKKQITSSKTSESKWRFICGRCAAFIKKETVLSASVLLGLLSCFAVPPDKGYLEYIDFRTLEILFCLMAVMAGLQNTGVFRRIAETVLARVTGVRQLAVILVLLCFFFSMAITNDVALITFVPFTLTVLSLLEGEAARGLLVPVVVMQTIAANLGSMLTPIGNPQNLYLYGKAGLDPAQFMGLMLPYTLVSLALLLVWCLWQGRVRDADKEKDAEIVRGADMPKDADIVRREKRRLVISFQSREDLTGKGRRIGLYLALFAYCLLAVARLLPAWSALAAVLTALLLTDRKALGSVDYGLLATFAGFFVFIGNMGRIPVFRELLERLVSGSEVLCGVAASQIISNVPAALLLSGFTEDYRGLIVGTNLGGLGTLIASMASLISFKFISREHKELRGPYLLYFTAANVCFLAVLYAISLVL